MKILVTGCAGFIGYHITEKLLHSGVEVVGIDNLNSYYSPQLKKDRLKQLGIESIDQRVEYSGKSGFVFLKIDIEDAEAMDKYLGEHSFDAICHLAAQAGVRYSITNPAAYIASNIKGFFNMVEYCRHNPSTRLVYASSSSVYGESSKMPYREDEKADSPASLYAATKKSNELMAYSYASLYGVDAIGLRFFTVYGPWGRPDMALFLFTDAILKGEPIEVFNNGEMERDFTYIDDIVEGVYRVLVDEPNECKEIAPLYNIGNSKPVKLLDFISTIEKAVGTEADKRYLPMQKGDVLATWADTSKLEREYGYSPSTSIEDGVGRFVEWYREYYDI